MTRPPRAVVRWFLGAVALAAASGCALDPYPRHDVAPPGAHASPGLPPPAAAFDADPRVQELAAEFEALQSENATLQARLEELQQALELQGEAHERDVQQFEEELDAKDGKLLRAAEQLREAREELALARDELARWKEEIVTLRRKVQDADRENVATLQATVSLVQQLLEENRPHDSGRPADDE